MSTEQPVEPGDVRQAARSVIDVVIQQHGNEVFLGEGYNADETLFDGIVAALGELRDINRTIAHQLERRADGMDPLTKGSSWDLRSGDVAKRIVDALFHSDAMSDTQDESIDGRANRWRREVVRVLDALPPAPEASPARFCECIGVAGHPNFVRTQHGRSVCVHCDLPRRADASPAKETR